MTVTWVSEDGNEWDVVFHDAAVDAELREVVR